jgi:hypothetical protein
MLRVIAKRTGYCDGFDNLRVDKVSVAAFPASVDEARSHKVVNKLSYFGGTTSPFEVLSPSYRVSRG